MKRGDLVTVSLQGDYGKPRPAVVVQSDFLSNIDSVVICPITSSIRDAVFRVVIEPDKANGLHTLSQVMVDKITTSSKLKISEPFGRLDEYRMKLVDRSILLVLALA